MSLATATIGGQPSLRMVSLKRLDRGGLVFTSGLLTRKVKELIANSHVAAAFYWPELGRQTRIEGLASLTGRDLAVELFAKRPRSHQLQTHASRQGEAIDDLGALRDRLEAIDVELGEAPVPCPDDWGVIRIVPNRIEFWEEASDRLHERLLFEAGDGGWRRSRLAP
jgi:pyridoxamine 5'-phosphate oxidase